MAYASTTSDTAEVAGGITQGVVLGIVPSQGLPEAVQRAVGAGNKTVYVQHKQGAQGWRRLYPQRPQDRAGWTN